MSFEVGDKVIYPNQGVGVIEDICTRQIAGQSEEYYRVKLTDTRSLVLVPVSNVDNVGMRKLSNMREVKRLFLILASDFAEPDPDWKTRYKLNLEKMNTGEVCEVAEVLRNLYLLSFRKNLSFREKKMLDRARQLVISEIATVRDQPFEDTLEEVTGILSTVYERSNGSAVEA